MKRKEEQKKHPQSDQYDMMIVLSTSRRRVGVFNANEREACQLDEANRVQ